MLIHSPSNDFVGDGLFAEKYVEQTVVKGVGSGGLHQ